MLTNAEMDSRATFACLLLGQPTLRRKLRQGTFAALDQRIALRCTIDGMDRKETGEYIAHHVKLAGRSDTLFSDDAVALIHEASRGLPRAGEQPRDPDADRRLRDQQVDLRRELRPRRARRDHRRMTGELVSLFDQHARRSRRPAGPQAITLPAPAGWPAPPEQAAYHGLPGAIVAKIAPHTEADPVAILTQLLVCCGALIGRGATSRSKRPCITPTSSWCLSVTAPRPGRAARSITSPGCSAEADPAFPVPADDRPVQRRGADLDRPRPPRPGPRRRRQATARRRARVRHRAQSQPPARSRRSRRHSAQPGTVGRSRC